MKKILKGGCAILAVVVMLITTASAETGMSNTKYTTVNNYDYRYWSLIANNVEGRVDADAVAGLDGMNYAPVGYMGAQARLYSSSGVLKASSTWVYNEGTSYPTASGSLTYKTTSGYYYSKGQVKFYDGEGYITYTSAATPNFAPTRSVISDKNVIIQKNDNGEIYGSGLFLDEIGVQPDLIIAEGINGEIGYVKAEDLNDAEIETPEQAVTKMRLSQVLCKPPVWCRIEAPHRRFTIWPERIEPRRKMPVERRSVSCCRWQTSAAWTTSRICSRRPLPSSWKTA